MSMEELVQKISALSIMEVSELVKQLKDTLGK